MTLSFRVERDQLRHAVEMVAKVAAAKYGNQATAGVRLQVEGDKLHLAATDLDTAITTTITVAGAGDGVAVVPAKRLSGAVAALPEGGVEVTGAGPTGVTLRRGKAKFSLPTYAAEEFPKIDAPVDGVALDGPGFRAALAAVVPAGSHDATRPQLNGVHVHSGADGQMVMVATDSYRLHKVVVAEPWDGAPATVPLTAVTQLVKFDADTIVVTRLDNKLAFSAGDTLLTTTLIAGEYPNYPQLITTPDARMEVDGEALVAAVKRVDFAVDLAGGIRFDLSAGRLAISGKAEDGSTSSDELEVEWDGFNLTFGSNPRFFCDALAMVGTARVEIRLTDALKPMYMRPVPDDGSTVACLMPIRQK